LQSGAVDDGITPPRMASSRSRGLDEPHIGKYRLIKTIGKGNFAKVKLAKHVPTGREVTLCQLLVRPKTIVFGRTYVLLQMFFIFFFRREISKMRGLTGMKFCTMVSTRANFIMLVQNFGGHTPKKFQGRKTCKIWPDFGWLRSSAVNISETDEDFQNRIFILCTAIPPALGETSPVKFGPVTLEISMLNRTHPKCIFRKSIFRPLGGSAPPNFYMR